MCNVFRIGEIHVFWLQVCFLVHVFLKQLRRLLIKHLECKIICYGKKTKQIVKWSGLSNISCRGYSLMNLKMMRWKYALKVSLWISSVSDKNFTWNHSATLLLIESYRKCKHLMDSSAYKKAEVFRKVSAELAEHGHSVTHQECLVKMKNLTTRYSMQSFTPYSTRRNIHSNGSWASNITDPVQITSLGRPGCI